MRGCVGHADVEVVHDALQVRIHFLFCPEQTHGVLCHFQRGDRHTARVCRLGRAKQHAGGLQQLDGLRSRGHVSTLCDGKAAVFDERPRCICVQLVLRGTGKRDLAGELPNVAATGVIDRIRALCRIVGDAFALDLLELLHERYVDAVRIVDVAAGIGHGYDLCAELLRLFAGIKRDVAGAGDDDGAAVEALARALEHFLREIAQAVARRLGAFKAAAVAQPLAGQRTVKFVVQAFVLAEQIADLTPADADVARRNVGVRTDVLVQLDHEALTEAHDLRVGFALRVKIAASLCTADGQAGQAVFEDLLEAEKLDDALVDRRMEAQAALVRADGVVELDAKAAVDVDTAAVVCPRDAELDDPVRLD